MDQFTYPTSFHWRSERFSAPSLTRWLAPTSPSLLALLQRDCRWLRCSASSSSTATGFDCFCRSSSREQRSTARGSVGRENLFINSVTCDDFPWEIDVSRSKSCHFYLWKVRNFQKFFWYKNLNVSNFRDLKFFKEIRSTKKLKFFNFPELKSFPANSFDENLKFSDFYNLKISRKTFFKSFDLKNQIFKTFTTWKFSGKFLFLSNLNFLDFHQNILLRSYL